MRLIVKNSQLPHWSNLFKGVFFFPLTLFIMTIDFSHLIIIIIIIIIIVKLGIDRFQLQLEYNREKNS